MESVIHRVADAHAGTVVDRFGNLMGTTGKGCRVVIEGADITHECFYAIETADGMLTAKCYKMDGHKFVMTPDGHNVDKIDRVGRGHIFYQGCCQNEPTIRFHVRGMDAAQFSQYMKFYKGIGLCQP